jgi:biopolymer transport protein ExbD
MIQFDIDEDLTVSRGGPDLTPMIDMVFILLVFFLITSAALMPVIDVEVPAAETGEKKEETEVTIILYPDSTIAINDIRIEKDQLYATLVRMEREFTVHDVFLQADRAIPFGTVVEVIDMAKKAGFEGISFVVKPE